MTQTPKVSISKILIAGLIFFGTAGAAFSEQQAATDNGSNPNKYEEKIRKIGEHFGRATAVLTIHPKDHVQDKKNAIESYEEMGGETGAIVGRWLDKKSRQK